MLKGLRRKSSAPASLEIFSVSLLAEIMMMGMDLVSFLVLRFLAILPPSSPASQMSKKIMSGMYSSRSW